MSTGCRCSAAQEMQLQRRAAAETGTVTEASCLPGALLGPGPPPHPVNWKFQACEACQLTDGGLGAVPCDWQHMCLPRTSVCIHSSANLDVYISIDLYNKVPM